MPVLAEDCIGIDKIMAEWLKDDSGNIYETDKEIEITIFPNPTENQLIIKSKEHDLLSIQIFDIRGKELFNKSNINQKEFYLQTKDFQLDNGNYKFKIITKNSSKFIPVVIEK